MDDALIAVFDAKYHYGFRRPITAIRNADTDGNDATERDASWSPISETPLHPEYPAALHPRLRHGHAARGRDRATLDARCARRPAPPRAG